MSVELISVATTPLTCIWLISILMTSQRPPSCLSPRPSFGRHSSITPQPAQHILPRRHISKPPPLNTLLSNHSHLGIGYSRKNGYDCVQKGEGKTPTNKRVFSCSACVVGRRKDAGQTSVGECVYIIGSAGGQQRRGCDSPDKAGYISGKAAFLGSKVRTQVNYVNSIK